jgi:hypothetical protein
VRKLPSGSTLKYTVIGSVRKGGSAPDVHTRVPLLVTSPIPPLTMAASHETEPYTRLTRTHIHTHTHQNTPESQTLKEVSEAYSQQDFNADLLA